MKVHSQTASNKGYWPIKVHIITEPNLTSKKEIITQKITLFVLYLLNRTAILVMSTDDLNSIGGDSYFESDIEELNSTIVKRPNLTRKISLESSLNKIANNLGKLEVETNFAKRPRSLNSSEITNLVSPTESNPVKRLKIAAKMLTLTSEVVKNDFHIVDIVSDDDNIEFFTSAQGNNIYTAVKEIMKANDIS